VGAAKPWPCSPARTWACKLSGEVLLGTIVVSRSPRATRHLADFKAFGVALLNPFKA
jgi:hypothetical protein